MGRESPESRISTFGNFDLALNGYMLAKTKLCLALKQFGAFIIMLHTGHIDSVATSTTRNVDPRRLLFLLLIAL